MEQAKTTSKPKKWRSKTGHKRQAKWLYGKDSELLLCVKVGGNFLPNIGSIDVRNKYRAPGPGNDYSATKKIALLKQLFEKGGMKGNNFEPKTVEFAAICPNESGSGMADLRKAIEIWEPGTGWGPNKVEAPTQSSSTWRVWMAGTNGTETIQFESIKPEHAQFCEKFYERSDVLDRFVDQESGSISPGFLIAAHLAAHACKKAKTGHYHRCYIYNSASSTAVCRVDLGTGRMMGFGAGNGWISPAAFHNL